MITTDIVYPPTGWAFIGQPTAVRRQENLPNITLDMRSCIYEKILYKYKSIKRNLRSFSIDVKPFKLKSRGKAGDSEVLRGSQNNGGRSTVEEEEEEMDDGYGTRQADGDDIDAEVDPSGHEEGNHNCDLADMDFDIPVPGLDKGTDARTHLGTNHTLTTTTNTPTIPDAGLVNNDGCVPTLASGTTTGTPSGSVSNGSGVSAAVSFYHPGDNSDNCQAAGSGADPCKNFLGNQFVVLTLEKNATKIAFFCDIKKTFHELGLLSENVLFTELAFAASYRNHTNPPAHHGMINLGEAIKHVDTTE